MNKVSEMKHNLENVFTSSEHTFPLLAKQIWRSLDLFNAFVITEATTSSKCRVLNERCHYRVMAVLHQHLLRRKFQRLD